MTSRFAAATALTLACLFASPHANAAPKVDDFLCRYARTDTAEDLIKECSILIDGNKGARDDRSKYYMQRAYGYREIQKCDLASSDLERAAALGNSKSFEMLLARALLAENCYGNDDDAMALYNDAIRRFPKENAAYLDKGNLLRKQGKYEPAAATLTQSITVFRAFLETRKRVASKMEMDINDGVLSNIYNTRALIWMEAQDYDKAAQDFATGLALQPENSKIIANRGKLWRLRGDLDRSLTELSRAVSLAPKSSLILSYRSETYRYAGKFDLAVADATAAIGLADDFAYAYVMRGLAYERIGKTTEAKADFEKSLTFKPYVYDMTPPGQTTARARLAALNSGVDAPVIPPTPNRTGPKSLPTPDAVVPKPVAPQAVRGKRAALVIGNSAYKNVAALPNPQRDAESVAATLRNIGFDPVIVAVDNSKEKLTEALRSFANEADKADWAMVYYAGHGIEVNGINYLIPVDAKLATDRDVQYETIPLDQAMTSVEGAKKLKLVVLDACRDNPFAPAMRKTAPVEVANRSTGGGVIGTRSIGRGLGEVKVSGATLVVYAAKHGQTALDGEGGNSPFAVAMVQRLATPGVEINKIFRLVRDDVMEATAGRQEPFTYGSLPGREDFYFVVK